MENTSDSNHLTSYIFINYTMNIDEYFRNFQVHFFILNDFELIGQQFNITFHKIRLNSIIVNAI